MEALRGFAGLLAILAVILAVINRREWDFKWFVREAVVLGLFALSPTLTVVVGVLAYLVFANAGYVDAKTARFLGQKNPFRSNPFRQPEWWPKVPLPMWSKILLYILAMIVIALDIGPFYIAMVGVVLWFVATAVLAWNVFYVNRGRKFGTKEWVKKPAWWTDLILVTNATYFSGVAWYMGSVFVGIVAAFLVLGYLLWVYDDRVKMWRIWLPSR